MADSDGGAAPTPSLFAEYHVAPHEKLRQYHVGKKEEKSLRKRMERAHVKPPPLRFPASNTERATTPVLTPKPAEATLPATPPPAPVAAQQTPPSSRPHSPTATAGSPHNRGSPKRAHTPHSARLEPLPASATAAAAAAAAAIASPGLSPHQSSSQTAYIQSLPAAIRKQLVEGSVREDTDMVSFFRLDYFDDSTYESRTPQEWLKGTRRACSRFFEKDNSWKWAPCTVLSYDQQKEMYLVEWDENKRQKLVSRLNLRFDEENVETFNMRLDNAIRCRTYYEARMGRQARLSVKDLTGTSDVPSAALRRTLGKMRLVPPARQPTLRDLVEEAKLNYKKINLEMEYEARHPVKEDVPEFLWPMLDALVPHTIPEKGTIDTTGNPADAAENRASFKRSLGSVSLQLPRSNTTILRAMIELWGVFLSELSAQRVLRTDLHSCTLAEFQAEQTVLFQNVVQSTKKEIQPTLINTIMRATTEEAQGAEKLSSAAAVRCFKLLVMCNLMLKDHLRDIIITSVQQFHDHFLMYDAALALHKARNPLAPDAESSAIPHWVMVRTLYPPVFKVDMIVTEGKLGFNPPLADFMQAVPNVIINMISLVRTLPAVEVASIESKYYQDVLDPVLENEKYVLDIIGSIKRALYRNIGTLTALQDGMKEYESMLSVSIPEFIATFANKNKTLSGFKFEIEKTQRYEQALEKKLEEHIAIGIFDVDCTQVKVALVTTSSQIRNACLNLLQTQSHTELMQITNQFQEMLDKLTKKPTTPVELADVTKLVDQVTTDLPELAQQISTIAKRYQLLEDFGYEVSNEEFDQKWRLMGWPRRIRQALFSIEKVNSIERLRMIRDLRANQKVLEERVFQLDALASEMYNFRDIEQAFVVGDKVRQIQGELNQAYNEAKTYCVHEELFGFKSSESSTTVEELMKKFEPVFTLWSTASNWLIQHNTWIQSPFTSLSAEQMNKVVTSSNRVAARLLKVSRGQKDALFTVATQLKQKIDNFKVIMPLVTKLRHQGVRQRHWEMIANEIGFQLPAGDHADEFTLGYVIDAHLEKHSETINKITDVAIHEYTLESALDKMQTELRAYTFQYSLFKETGTYFIHSTDDLADILEDQWVRLATMLTSPYIDTLLSRATNWKSTLEHVRSIFNVLMQCQKKWIYLTPIFNAQEIRNELPGETRKFQAVDTTWRKTMNVVNTNSKVLTVCTQENLLKQLEDCNKALEVINAALNDYLETKRTQFNRFYFISDGDLIDILAHCKDPTAVQPHLKKCFENIDQLRFAPVANATAPNMLDIKAMISGEGEKVLMGENVTTVNKEVGAWLSDVESVMKKTLQKLLGRALASYSKFPKDTWITSWPAQLILVANQIIFTQQVTRILSNQASGELKNLRAKLVEGLNELTSKIRGDLPPLQRVVMAGLIVFDVHNRDVVSDLLRADVADETMLEWIQQMRYYWEAETCVIRVLQSEMTYSYEYLGNTSRLVITPLTDRVYRTLTNALHLNLGGAPSGPAGTGKTETVRDLAKAVGKMCVVFNCSDSLDFAAVGKMLKGLASSGSWCCFDEFNRIKVEVLSTTSSQILAIQQAIALLGTADNKKFKFGTTEITLDRTCAIYVTMNPGYAGRSELPDNLKALFRPVAMTAADQNYIAEILLFCAGFQDATHLAQRLVKCLHTASQVLSAQSHYDFAMRALKAVLFQAEVLKRREPLQAEALLVVNALLQTNVPKMVDSDIPIFRGVVQSLFPEVTVADAVNGRLRECVVRSIEAMGLQPLEAVIAKCVQIYETMVTRHGVMVVGGPGAGKTSCMRVIVSALNMMAEAGELKHYKRVEMHILNPKSISMNQLFGYFTPTLEWIDGVLTKLVRKALECAGDQSAAAPASSAAAPASGSEVAAPSSTWFLIVFDGPVDSLWIESLNSVLDDSKTMCLASGERILIPPHLSFIFEVLDLAVASPATVSRCGMVYVDTALIDWAAVVACWLKTVPNQLQFLQTTLEKFITDYVVSAIHTVKDCKCVVDTPATYAVRNLLMLFDCFMYHLLKSQEQAAAAATKRSEDDEDEEEKEEKAQEKASTQIRRSAAREDEEVKVSLWKQQAALMDQFAESATKEQKAEIVEPLFLFCIVQAIGSLVAVSDRPKIDAAVRQLLATQSSAFAFPASKSVYDFYFNFEKKQWCCWADVPEVRDFKVSPGQAFDTSPVPTAECVCVTFLTEALLSRGNHVYTLGASGIGKTMYTSHFLYSILDSTAFVPRLTNLSLSSTPSAVQYQLESALEKRKNAKTLIPPAGKRVVFMLDDAHTPSTEESGAQPPLELLRQYLDYDGWYNDNEFRHVRGLVFLAVGTITESARQFPLRFLRHFFPLFVPDARDDTLQHILDVIMQAQQTNFPHPVQQLRPKLAAATLVVLRSCQTLMHPAVSKLHYLFTPVDAFKVIKGLLGVRGDASLTQMTITRMWFHECLRVFGDKLNNDTDYKLLLKVVEATCESHIGATWSSTGGYRGDRAPLFCDFFSGNYAEVNDVNALVENIKGHLNDYNSIAESPMDLFLFLEAVEHIVRTLRIIKQRSGHALLLGMGGSGRQSLTRIAAQIAQVQLEQITATRKYNRGQWIEDLKRVLRKAGLQGHQILFLVSDAQLSDISFFEDINNLVHNGSVPGLFSSEDIDAICQSMRAFMKGTLSQSQPITAEYLFSRFIEQVKANLHIVICMSPFQKLFRTSVSLFPPLFTFCTVDWYHLWPTSALKIVATESLKDLDTISAEPARIAEVCVSVHNAVEATSKQFVRETGNSHYLTSSKFLEFIRLFKEWFVKRQAENTDQTLKLTSGLEKVDSVSRTVHHIQQHIEQLLPQLEVMSREEEKMMANLSLKRKDCDTAKADVEKEEKLLVEEAKQADEIKQSAEDQLKQALPHLEAAEKALNTISRKEITEIRALANPPAGMTIVIEALCIMFGRKPRRVEQGGQRVEDYWPEARSLMDMNFLQKLTAFDKDNISEETIAKLKPYLTKPQFQLAAVERINQSLKYLCLWIRAMERFYWINKSVMPKRKKLEEAKARVVELNAKVQLSRDRLKELEDNLATLSAQYNAAEAKKASMQAEIQDSQVKMERAKSLLTGLSSEKIIWVQKIADLTQQLSTILGDTLLSCSYIVYMGAFPSSYRQDLLTVWEGFLGEKGIAFSLNYSLSGVMGDPVKIRDWTMHSLPSDSHSVDNGILTTATPTCPLLLDPQGQLGKWLNSIELKEDPSAPEGVEPVSALIVSDINSPALLRTLETCVQFGSPLLLEGVSEDIDPALFPVLSASRTGNESGQVVRVGDKVFPKHKNFRLYLSSKLASLRLSPEMFAKVNLINFSITREGVAEQLLGKIVNHEKRDLEKEVLALVEIIAKAKKLLHDLDEDVLTKLYSTQGDLLADDKLPDALAYSKKTSDETIIRLEDAERVRATSNEARIQYQPLATYAAGIYAVVCELSGIDHMYQYSLRWFTDLLEWVLAQPTEEAEATLAARCEGLRSRLLLAVYDNVTRGIFEKHKLLFSLLLAVRPLQFEAKLSTREWNFLVIGPACLGQSQSAPIGNPAPEWLSSTSWEWLCALPQLPGFEQFIPECFVKHLPFWKEYCNSPQAHRQTFPGGWHERLSSFARLLVLRSLRPDKMKEGVQDFIVEHLGKAFIDPPQFDLEVSYNMSTPQKPLIFLLSPGTDPTAAIYEFAERKDMVKRISPLSLGGDTGPAATKSIAMAIDRGDWVLLQNCHLAVSWLPELEKLVRDIPPDRVHQKFRLWLTAKPLEEFPVFILRAGIKITNQPPRGIRGNLLRGFSKVDPVLLQENMGNILWHKLLFGICYMHASMVERFKFGPLGWNKPYEFNDSDLSICLRMVNFLSEQQDDSGTANVQLLNIIRYLSLECIYGGYITEEYDRRLLLTLGEDIFSLQITQPKYKLSESGRYTCPAPGGYDDYMNYIRSLPINDEPEAFGLHENAEITFAMMETKAMFDTLQRQKSDASDSSSEEQIVLGVVDDMIERLPASFSMSQVSEMQDALMAFLRKEAESYNRLLSVMSSSLVSLKQALAGVAQYTPALYAMRWDILRGAVPQPWAAVSYPSLKPLNSWYNDLLRRVSFLQDWVAHGRPKSFWFCGFFYPKSFLSGLMQNYAQEHKISVDMVSFGTEIVEGGGDAPEEKGTHVIHGLFLEGASWADGQLAECLPKQLHCQLQPVRLRPKVEHQGRNQRAEKDVYRCPVYNTMQRTGPMTSAGQSANFVMQINLPTNKPESYWIKRGAALFCQISS
eukprot:TRINITY_DN6953_c0_g1_i1.p1 TRINITY_DN6953_c0_g1~~TRINITY_DN6953_c0_g1_i1.p1  ORF type:complete len:4254 (+),score=1253.29 TRINITY_DN6953_c0_g1_i1:29-12763(+)